MNHGDLIKSMRKRRGITRSELAFFQGSVSSLKRFENNESKIDFDLLWVYLERMNIQIDEYHFEYNNYHLSHKDSIRLNFKQALKSEKSFTDYMNTLQTEYAISKDIYYLYLIIQLKAVALKLPKFSSKKSTIEKKEIESLFKYLEKISEWGYFEFALYTNCLSLFENNYLLFNLTDVLAQFEKFKTSYKYKLVLVKFLINSLILSFERESYDKIPKLLEVLYKESEDSDFMKGRIYWKFFNSLYHSITGNFDMDSTIYIDMLALLGYEDDVQNMRDIEICIQEAIKKRGT